MIILSLIKYAQNVLVYKYEIQNGYYLVTFDSVNVSFLKVITKKQLIKVHQDYFNV